MRVYNWCCHVLNGGEHEYRKGQPKLAPVSKRDKDVQQFEVLRDVLIKFSYLEWGEFTKRTYEIWTAYRRAKDGPSQSEKMKDCIHAMRHTAIVKFKRHKKDYLAGRKKAWTKVELSQEVAQKTNIPANTIRKYCNGIDLSLKWAKENEENHQYQNLSRKPI